VCAGIDCASSTEDGNLDTTGGDVHALADTDLDTTTDPDYAPDLDPATDINAHRDVNPAPDLDAVTADSNGHCC
jgi:hypothetical protein